MSGTEGGHMKKPTAEFIGTFTLVFFGCGAAIIGGMGTGPTAIDVLGIAFAFGLAIVAMAYGIGSSGNRFFLFTGTNRRHD
jgi:glycerol uptake facilitator-like aquaporin